MEKRKNRPRLRFSEFEGEWGRKKLGDIGEIVTGSTPPTANSSYYNGDFLFVSPIDIKGNRYVTNTKTTLTQNGFSKGRKIPEGSSMFVCIGSTIGKVAQANKECITNQQINSILPIENTDFVFSLLEFHSSKIKLLSAVQAVPIINKSTFLNYTLYFPALPEQQKIASFFTAIDKKISQLKRKKNLLEQYKKGVMQKIFSQQIRFKDDDGQEFPKWEKMKLGDLLIECSVKTTISNQYRVLSSTVKGLFNQDEYFNQNIASKDNTGYKILILNQLVLSPQNLWLGNINVNTEFEVGIVSPSYKIFSFNNKFTTVQYCKNFLITPRMMFEYEQSSEQGASVVRRNLDMDIFYSIKINLPTLPEQTKIANFLSSIDDKINLTQKQIENAEVWKKGLMQQMFV